MNNDIMIDVASKVFSTYLPGDEKFCVFCSSHEDGDTLYDMSDWDGGIEFNYIRNIHYCPICGKELKKHVYAR